MGIIAVKKYIEQSFREKFPTIRLVDNAIEYVDPDNIDSIAVSVHIPEVESNINGLYGGSCPDRANVNIVIAQDCMIGITNIFDELTRDNQRRLTSEALSNLAGNIYLWASNNNFYPENPPDGVVWPRMFESTIIDVSRLVPEFATPREGHVIRFSVPCNLYERFIDGAHRVGAEIWGIAETIDRVVIEDIAVP